MLGGRSAQHTASRFEMDKEMYAKLDGARAHSDAQRSAVAAAVADVHARMENGERRLDAVRYE
jgi:hypothetical protein